MARTASGEPHLEGVLQVIRTAKSTDELCAAHTVALPVLRGLSMQDTAAVIGRLPGAACRMGASYYKAAGKRQAPARSTRALRNYAQLELQAEANLLQEVLAEAANGGRAGDPASVAGI